MRATLLLAAVVLPTASHAAVDFINDVRPIFEQRCYKCHGAEKQKSGLRLDVKADALKGGDDHGPDIVPGQSAKSPLLQLVTSQDEDELMPPRKNGGDRLTSQQVATLRAWIDEGAVWPDNADKVAVKDKADHWSFKPVRRPALPEVQDRSWPRNPIDRFILARLEREGLKPSPEADRLSWLRRVYINLIGLPPTPEQVSAFLNDTHADAYDRVVDELLASPGYGEHWARHWLDIIAFGETHGFEVNTPRPNAWPYRDYVIRAFNADKPYPDFIKDQLAGDATGEDAATGFIVAAAALLSGQIGKDKESKLLARQDELNSMVLGSGAAFLGLTINCARCHDHKFDPISQRDYYSMQAIFAGVRHGERPLRSADAVEHERQVAEVQEKLQEYEAALTKYEPLASIALADGAAHRPPIHPARNVDRFAPIRARRVRFTIEETNALEPCLDEIEIFTTGASPRNVALASAGGVATASGSRSSGSHQLAHLNDGKYGNEHSWLSDAVGKGWVEIEFAKDEEIEKVIWARDRQGRYTDRLATKYRIEASAVPGVWKMVASSADRAPYAAGRSLNASMPAVGEEVSKETEKLRVLINESIALRKRLPIVAGGAVVYAGYFIKPEPMHLLHRGDPMQPQDEVPPGAVARLGPALDLAPDAPEQARRLALAQWIGSERNPLTARVLVNRLWHYQFGEGIVNTPSDFGNNGAAPTNQELLDWMASEFMAQGWSLKKMQRLICLSAAYRQSSHPDSKGMGVDAGSRLLWRFPPRRMDAEVIHDAILAVSGTLDRKMGGPGYNAFAPNDNYVRVYDPKTEYGPADWRRMIYQTKVRMAQDSTFGAFDCPDAGQPQPRRARSTTPLQALNLLNSHFVNQQADFLAKRLANEAGADPAAQVTRAFALALGRQPDPHESASCAAFIRQYGLPNFCRVVLNLNEFVFIP